MQDFIFFEESWNSNQNINQMSSKFFGNSLTPNTKAEKLKMKGSKSTNVTKQGIKKAGRGK